MHGSGSATQMEDSRMMTPQTKRYKGDNYMGSESPILTGEIFLPTDLDKLKKIFPYIDTKVMLSFIIKRCSN